MNRDGKRFENLDQILRHLVALGQHKDEIDQVRLSKYSKYQTNTSIITQYCATNGSIVYDRPFCQMQSELARDGWFWREGLPKGWLLKKTVSKIIFLTPTFARCKNVQQVNNAHQLIRIFESTSK